MAEGAPVSKEHRRHWAETHTLAQGTPTSKEQRSHWAENTHWQKVRQFQRYSQAIGWKTHVGRRYACFRYSQAIGRKQTVRQFQRYSQAIGRKHTVRLFQRYSQAIWRKYTVRHLQRNSETIGQNTQRKGTRVTTEQGSHWVETQQERGGRTLTKTAINHRSKTDADRKECHCSTSSCSVVLI